MKRCFASVLAILLLCLSFAAPAEKQEEHHMGDWHSRSDGFHSANCTICGYPMRVPCTDFAATFAPGVKLVRRDGSLAEAGSYADFFWLEPGDVAIFAAP